MEEEGVGGGGGLRVGVGGQLRPGSSGEADTRSLPSILPRRDGKNLIIQLLKISLLAELHLHEGGRKGWGGVGGSSGETT